MKKTQIDRYAARGVSAGKEEVHAAVDKLDQGLFKGAFCKITQDYLTGSKSKCNVIHSDGSGTKSIIAYLYFKETGDASVFKGISQDSIVMNIDDLLCIGAFERILLSNTVNRNARNFPGSALAQLILGSEEFLARLRKLGVNIYSGGGETADVGDLTGAVVVDSCAVAVMRRKDVITGGGIKPGLSIVGLSSAGRAKYEDFENSGIGSNGLTSARHDMLSPYYRKKYPETFDPNTDKKLVYCGPYKLGDKLEGSNMTVGQALLSPTRTYAPIIMKIVKKYPKLIKGLVHCSGGGQTKCLRFGKGVHFVKDNLMPVPPIFKAIQNPVHKHRAILYRKIGQATSTAGRQGAAPILDIRKGGYYKQQVSTKAKVQRRQGDPPHGSQPWRSRGPQENEGHAVSNGKPLTVGAIHP